VTAGTVLRAAANDDDDAAPARLRRPSARWPR